MKYLLIPVAIVALMGAVVYSSNAAIVSSGEVLACAGTCCNCHLTEGDKEEKTIVPLCGCGANKEKEKEDTPKMANSTPLCGGCGCTPDKDKDNPKT